MSEENFSMNFEKKYIPLIKASLMDKCWPPSSVTRTSAVWQVRKGWDRGNAIPQTTLEVDQLIAWSCSESVSVVADRTLALSLEISKELKVKGRTVGVSACHASWCSTVRLECIHFTLLCNEDCERLNFHVDFFLGAEWMCSKSCLGRTGQGVSVV